MPKPKRRDLAKERYWRRMLRLWQRSGQTGRDFCAAYGLPEPSFYAWRREIARRDQEPPPPTRTPSPPAPASDAKLPVFQELLLADAPPPPTAIEVVLTRGHVLRIAPGFDADLLRQLLRVLEEPPC
jgi:hypothetical protein